jgi:hypothetical protein
MSTFPTRTLLVNIARADKDKVEVTKNTAPWIRKFWPATTYHTGMANQEPYCAAAVCFWVQQWLTQPETLRAFQMSPPEAEAWRCKSASVAGWSKWAKEKKLQLLPPRSILRRGDLVIYDYSHIEIVTDDDGTLTGPFIAIGANTNAAASRDGEGTFEKPRNRARVKHFIRLLAP